MAKLLTYALAASMSGALRVPKCTESEAGNCKQCGDNRYVYICGSGLWQKIDRGPWECLNGEWNLPTITAAATYRPVSIDDDATLAPAMSNGAAMTDADVPVSSPDENTTISQAKHIAIDSTKFSGDLTWFATGLGACGKTNKNGDNVTAISHILYDAADLTQNPNENPLCGRLVRAQRYNEASEEVQRVDLTVVDRCEACTKYDLDVTPATFEMFAPVESGRVKIEWEWREIDA